jgi:hypothetical protein
MFSRLGHIQHVINLMTTTSQNKSKKVSAKDISIDSLSCDSSSFVSEADVIASKKIQI